MNMMKERKRKRYSTAFKRKVVREVETGHLSVQDARRLYDIGGGSTSTPRPPPPSNPIEHIANM